MKKGYILVEGHGELEAAHNLVMRLSRDSGHLQHWAPPARWKNLHLRTGIERAVNRVRTYPDAGALLILRDEDDRCPREKAPEIASWIELLAPPFPVAVVLLHPEYEVLFLPCLERMAGRPIVGPDGQERAGLRPNTKYKGDWEAKRGIKEWLSHQFPPGRSYKPTLDQLALTRMIDFQMLRDAKVPCFGTLERALAFLASSFGERGVYPPPARSTGAAEPRS